MDANWWPWWVTTLVASAVVLAAALALLRSTRAEIRGALSGVIVLGVSAAIGAPIVMSGDMDGDSTATMAAAPVADSSMAGGRGSMTSSGMRPSIARHAPATMPFTFFFTRYEWDGAARVTYHSDGAPTARSANGSTLSIAGRGGWDPASGTAAGGGRYVLKSRDGSVVRGEWRATRFISLTQLPGWLPGQTREAGRQGPRGSTSFTGILKLAVALERRGGGVLTAWCVLSPEAQRATGRWWDGVTLVGPRLRFTNFKVNEGRAAGGVMFYGPGTTGA